MFKKGGKLFLSHYLDFSGFTILSIVLLIKTVKLNFCLLKKRIIR